MATVAQANTVKAVKAKSSGKKKISASITEKGVVYVTATLTVETAVKKAVDRGMKTADIIIKGPGSGRDSSLRAIKAGGLSITSISDRKPIPHNGPRAKKKRRM